MGVALGDYEHKGLFSIAITHFSEEYAALYRNNGGLSFTDVSYPSGIAPATTPYVGWGDAFFDLDNDGWPDLILVNGTFTRRWIASTYPPNFASLSCSTSTSTMAHSRHKQAGRPGDTDSAGQPGTGGWGPVQ